MAQTNPLFCAILLFIAENICHIDKKTLPLHRFSTKTDPWEKESEN